METKMNKLVYKTLNATIITLLSCSAIACITLLVPSFLFLCISVFKGDMEKVYEFIPVVIVSPIAVLLFLKIGNIWRKKTIKYRDEGEKTWMD